MAKKLKNSAKPEIIVLTDGREFTATGQVRLKIERNFFGYITDVKYQKSGIRCIDCKTHGAAYGGWFDAEIEKVED